MAPSPLARMEAPAWRPPMGSTRMEAMRRCWGRRGGAGVTPGMAFGFGSRSPTPARFGTPARRGAWAWGRLLCTRALHWHDTCARWCAHAVLAHAWACMGGSMPYTPREGGAARAHPCPHAACMHAHGCHAPLHAHALASTHAPLHDTRRASGWCLWRCTRNLCPCCTWKSC
jgi:hypothetical protein